MEIKVEKLFGALVISGIALAGCRETERASVDSGTIVADSGPPAVDAGPPAEDAGPPALDAGTDVTPDEDAGVDSWLSWT